MWCCGISVSQFSFSIIYTHYILLAACISSLFCHFIPLQHPSLEFTTFAFNKASNNFKVLFNVEVEINLFYVLWYQGIRYSSLHQYLGILKFSLLQCFFISILTNNIVLRHNRYGNKFYIHWLLPICLVYLCIVMISRFVSL